MKIYTNIKILDYVMQQFGRRKIIHHIETDHRWICFKLCGIRGKILEKTELDFEKDFNM